MPAWLQVLTSLTAAVIGGVIAPQITQARERRAARAAVLEKITDAEALWLGDESYQDFRRAITALEAAAIVGGLPRVLVLRYILAARLARQNSSYEPVGVQGESLWIIDSRYTDQARVALRYLSLAVWHPHITRWSLRLRMFRPPDISTSL